MRGVMSWLLSEKWKDIVIIMVFGFSARRLTTVVHTFRKIFKIHKQICAWNWLTYVCQLAHIGSKC